MATKKTPKLKATNAEIVRAMWTDASQEYQHRIPAADQGDITETIERLFDDNYRPQLNEFATMLINRIGSVVIRAKSWKNPLAVFKRGLMEYGDTIEEIAFGVIQAKRFDPNKCETDVFACSPPQLEANYHTINRQDRYDMTLSRQMLRRAFVDEYGLQSTIDGITTIPYNSDELDEYLIMRNLLAEYARNNGFYKIEVPDLVNASPDETEGIAKVITQKIRAMVGRLKFYSGDYNPSHIPTFSRADELVVIGIPEFIAALDVNVIASAFNVSAAQLNVRFIEVDDLGIDGAQAILCDENFFLCCDTLLEFADIYNPKGLAWNSFLHHHGIYSVSRFVNAILFTTEAGTISTVPTITVSGVTVSISSDNPPVNGTTPTFAAKGATLRLAAEVAGSVTPPTTGYFVPQGVVWKLSGTSGYPLSIFTFIDAEGVLHVSENESNTEVEVTATSTYIDPTKPMADQVYQSGTLKIGIGAAIPPTPDPEPTDPDDGNDS